jgi:hypothetical protein
MIITNRETAIKLRNKGYDVTTKLFYVCTPIESKEIYEVGVIEQY